VAAARRDFDPVYVRFGSGADISCSLHSITFEFEFWASAQLTIPQPTKANERGHFARGASANANVNVGECRSTHKSGPTIVNGYCDA
jgi:hypothetical protein